MTELEQKKLNEKLLNATVDGNLKRVKELLGRGANIEAKTIQGWTALHWAAYKGRLETVKDLLGAGADIEVRDKEGWTPLHLAASNGNLEVVKELLGRGANIEAKTIQGWTALHIASNNGKSAAAKELLGAGAELDLYTLFKYPKLSSERIQEGKENKWESVLLLILKEKEKYDKDEFEKDLLGFLDKVKNGVPENISIVLKTLV